MSTTKPDVQKIADTVDGHEKTIAGLQNNARSLSSELHQALDVIGKIRQEHELSKSEIKRLQLEMETVYSYLKEHRIP